jgi:hypothetical protein
VIDELMGHEASTRGAQHLGSTMGAHYRHTTPEMATRVVMAIQDRLAVVVRVAEQVVEAQPTQVPRNVFCRLRTAFSGNLWQWRLEALRACKRPGAGPGLSCAVGVEPPAEFEPPTPSLPWISPSPPFAPAFPQAAPDRRMPSYGVRLTCPAW